MTEEQRKGFKKWYNVGCTCSVQNGPVSQKSMKKGSQLSNQSSKSCSWDTKFEGTSDCQSLHSICAPTTNPTSLKLRRRSMNGYRLNGRRSSNRRSYARESGHHRSLNDVETEQSGSNCHWIQSQTYRDCMKNRMNEADSNILKKYEESRVTKIREP